MLQLFFAGEIRALRIRPPGPAMFPEFSELVPSDILHNSGDFHCQADSRMVFRRLLLKTEFIPLPWQSDEKNTAAASAILLRILQKSTFRSVSFSQ